MRALILLLAFLLPMQLSWAAVASYCQAERETAPAHLGHHDHPAAETHAQAESKDSKAGDLDLDCSLCQFFAMKSVQAAGTLLYAPQATRLPAHIKQVSHPASHIADGPDKPNWLLAA
ncbi:cobalt transporter [Herbaspirillum aquaticum]|jgi:hypothetical protein|uniref:Cobalt transporter n=1 Tax=Herbaspirillum aquaticum TaxID=568783 RepID=A0A225SR12_9BURK|nr:cobalt transporter [Herbaspirillum aquaticum]MBW9335378.1 cobalt transporter [Herbaspirillum sp. RU 5E]OWY32949.1 cobalt transporter [Herbaspirillum aquaticum]